MKKNSFEVGDIIRIDRPGYKHVGVYVGQRGFNNHCVVHNRKGMGVVLDTIDNFSGGFEIFIHEKATCEFYEREIIAQRALSLLGTKYDLIKFNCEHAAYYAQGGVAKSPQVDGWAFLGLIACGVAALSVLNSKKA